MSFFFIAHLLDIVQERLMLFLIISAVGMKPGCDIELLRGGVLVEISLATHSLETFWSSL